MGKRRPWQIDFADASAGPGNSIPGAGGPESAPSDIVRSGEALFLREAREKAAAEGISVEEVLDRDVARALADEYPGPECLTPEQIERCVLEEPDQDELEHLSRCADCQRLLEMSHPSSRRRQRAMEVVRQVTNQSRSSAAENKARLRAREFAGAPALVGALACTFIAGMMAAGPLSDYLSDGRTLNSSDVAQSELAVSPAAKKVVLKDETGKYWVFDVEGTKKPVEFKLVFDPKITFSRDDETVTEGRGSVLVWDVDALKSQSEPKRFASLKKWMAAVKDNVSEVTTD